MKIDTDSDEIALHLASGCSRSVGIAGAVTVLAHSAAETDAAAPPIANPVDCAHPTIRRSPANLLHEDTDLGNLPVTADVGALLTLDQGAARVFAMRQARLIAAASLPLQGRSRGAHPDLPWRVLRAVPGEPLENDHQGHQQGCHQGTPPCSIAQPSWP